MNLLRLSWAWWAFEHLSRAVAVGDPTAGASHDDGFAGRRVSLVRLRVFGLGIDSAAIDRTAARLALDHPGHRQSLMQTPHTAHDRRIKRESHLSTSWLPSAGSIACLCHLPVSVKPALDVRPLPKPDMSCATKPGHFDLLPTHLWRAGTNSRTQPRHWQMKAGILLLINVGSIARKE
jgi:hypothetical protein